MLDAMTMRQSSIEHPVSSIQPSSIQPLRRPVLRLQLPQPLAIRLAELAIVAVGIVVVSSSLVGLAFRPAAVDPSVESAGDFVGCVDSDADAASSRLRTGRVGAASLAGSDCGFAGVPF